MHQNGEKNVVKLLKLIDYPTSCFEYNVLFILITKQSSVFFYCTKTEKVRNQNGHCLVKMSRHEKIMFRLYVLFVCLLVGCLFLFLFVLFCFVLFFSFSSPSVDYNVLEKF